MSISINNNNGIIEISQDNSVPKSYFRASGKFYPSGTIGGLLIDNLSFVVFSDNTTGLVDGGYNDILSTSNGSGTPNAIFNIDVISGVASGINISNFADTSGYGMGDFITIQGSDLGGSGEIVLKVTVLDIDGLLIVIGGDFYEVKWYDLVIDGTSPTSLSDAQSLLAATLATAPPSLSLTVSNNSIFDIPANSGGGIGNFTIEWGAKMTADDNHPRAWSIGSFPSAAHAVSIENGILYYWANGGIVGNATLIVGYIGVWTYFTIMRKAAAIYIFQDGIQIASFGFGDAIPTNGLPLYLGSEGNDSLQNGLMSNFRWNDTDVYSPYAFPTPSVPLTSIPGTKLLIFQGDTLPLEITDNSGMGNVINNGTGIYNADNPFGSPYEGSIQFGTI
jgi:hypothetical protein